MSACPLPDNSEKLVYGTTGTLTAGNPDPSDESCNLANTNSTTSPAGGTTTITQTQFCAGPQGPTGADGAAGDAGLCGLGFEDNGEWATGVDYYNQEENVEFGNDYHCNASFVVNNGASYYCVYGHTAGSDVDGDEPGVGLNWEFYWLPMSLQGEPGISEKEQTLLGSLWDHILDIPNWGWGDYLTAIAAVAAGAILYDELQDSMEPEAGDNIDHEAYTGDPAYSGAPINATLPNVIEDICQSMPFTVDVSQLTSHELSFKRTNLIPYRNMLAQLSLVYAFSITPSGSTLKFIPYDAASVATLTFDDMGYGLTSSNTSRYKVERTQGIDLPRKIILQYPDRDLNYQDNIVEYEITAYPEGQVVRVQIPFVMSFTEARAIAERGVMLAHLEATKYTYVVAFEDWMQLEPGDTITTPLGNHRIIGIDIRSDGGMEIKAVDASYVSEFTVPSGDGVGTLPTVNTTVDKIGVSGALFMDMPPLNSDDQDGRIIAAVHGYGYEKWHGAGIYESFDGGSSYELVTTATKEATFGRVATAIPAPTDYLVWDDDTTITVELRTGDDLLSVTDDTLYAGHKNHAMVGNEMIAFGTVSLVTASNVRGNREYELTHLLRGLQGTEWAVGEHADGEAFILLDDALVELPYPLDQRGKERDYKIVTVGGNMTDGVTKSVTPFGINLVPWRPSHGAGEKLGATDDWLITWEERARFAPDEVEDYVEPAHDFDWAGWIIQILDDTDQTVRTEHVVEPQFTYTEAMQITDFGTVRSCIKAKVVANSTVVGGGYSYTFTCT